MKEFEGFSMAFRGYSCSEVDEFVTTSIKTEGELRESCTALQKKNDELLAENERLVKDNERITSDCATLAVSLKKLRDTSATAINTAENTELKYNDESDESDELYDVGSVAVQEDYKAKYKNALLEIEHLKKEQQSAKLNEPVECGEVASQMVSEVAEVVKKLERDARRKAEAITLSAKLEQAQAQLIKSRVNEEVKSLVDMLNSYLSEHPDTAE